MGLSLKYIDETDHNIIQEVEDFLNSWNDSSDIITTMSSGSTGAQKKIELKKSAMTASARATGAFFDFKKDQTILLNLSPKYIGGKMILVRALTYNMKVLVVAPSKNPLCEIPENTTLDFAAFVPYQVHHILQNANTTKLFTKIKNVIIGGGAVSDSLEGKIKSCHLSAYSTFGMTETISHIALKHLGHSNYYTCLPSWTIGVDERSCLKIESNEILQEPLVTNDIIELKRKNEFKWKGRFDFMINSGGVKIFPEEIERVIGKFLETDTFYVTSQKDARLGEKVVLVSNKAIDFQALQLNLKEWISSYQIPKELIRVEEIIKTPTGKIIRDRF